MKLASSPLLHPAVWPGSGTRRTFSFFRTIKELKKVTSITRETRDRVIICPGIDFIHQTDLNLSYGITHFCTILLTTKLIRSFVMSTKFFKKWNSESGVRNAISGNEILIFASTRIITIRRFHLMTSKLMSVFAGDAGFEPRCF